MGGHSERLEENLANIHLADVLDLWIQAWHRDDAGDVVIVRYADSSSGSRTGHKREGA